MDAQIEIQRLRSEEAFEVLQHEWNQLLVNSANREIFFTWEWLFAWWQTFGDKNNLWLLTVRENGNLIGIAPFMMSTRKKLFFKLRVLRGIGRPQCDTSGFIATKMELVGSAICSYLKEHKNEWDIFELKSIPKNICEKSLVQEQFKKEGFRVIQNTKEHYYLPIRESWEDYFQSLSKNLRRNLKKRLKSLQKLGSVTHKIYTGDNLQWDHFLTIFELNEKGSFPDLYRSKRRLRFHQSLYDLMKKKCWIQIEILYLDDNPIAFQYGYNYGNKYHDWRGAYDREYQPLGIGKLLTMFSLKEHFSQGLEEIDFLRGAHEYKADWQPYSRDYIDIRVYQKNNLRSAILYWLKTLKPILKRS